MFTLQLRRKVLPWDNSPFLAFFSPTAPKAGTEPYGKVGQPPWGCPGRRNLESAVQRPSKAQRVRARSKTKNSTFKFRLKREQRRTHLKNATCLQHIVLNASLERFESSLNGAPFHLLDLWISKREDYPELRTLETSAREDDRSACLDLLTLCPWFLPTHPPFSASRLSETLEGL